MLRHFLSRVFRVVHSKRHNIYYYFRHCGAFFGLTRRLLRATISFSIPSKVIIISNRVYVLGYKYILALLRARFNPCVTARAKISLSSKHIYPPEHKLYHFNETNTYKLNNK